MSYKVHTKVCIFAIAEMQTATVQSKMKQIDRYKEKRAYILEQVHDGSLSNMDAVVLVGVGLAPPVQHDDGHRLPLGELRVVRQRPREPRAPHRQRTRGTYQITRRSTQKATAG
jgi:hypothetical protein